MVDLGDLRPLRFHRIVPVPQVRNVLVGLALTLEPEEYVPLPFDPLDGGEDEVEQIIGRGLDALDHFEADVGVLGPPVELGGADDEVIVRALLAADLRQLERFELALDRLGLGLFLEELGGLFVLARPKAFHLRISPGSASSLKSAANSAAFRSP